MHRNAWSQSAETGGRQLPNQLVDLSEIRSAGQLSSAELQGISQTSCNVLREMDSGVHWLHSYVTDDRIYCVWIAPNEEAVREHARRGGFPADEILPVKTVIDATTAES